MSVATLIRRLASESERGIERVLQSSRNGFVSTHYVQEVHINRRGSYKENSGWTFWLSFFPHFYVCTLASLNCPNVNKYSDWLTIPEVEMISLLIG